MSNDVLSALRAANKLKNAISSGFKSAAPGFKLPEDTYIVKIKKFEMKAPKNYLIIERNFTVVKSPTGEYDGCDIQASTFLSSDKTYVYALSMFKAFGVPDVQERFDKDGTLAFNAFCNDASKIKSTFSASLTYYKDKHANLEIIRKEEDFEPASQEPAMEAIEELASSKDSFIEAEFEVEETSLVKEEIIDDFTKEELLEIEEIIDDFADDDIQQDEINFDDDDIEVPKVEVISTEIDIKLRKKMEVLCIVQDIEIDDVKNQSNENIIEAISASIKAGKISKADLSKADLTLLKKIGLENLIK